MIQVRFPSFINLVRIQINYPHQKTMDVKKYLKVRYVQNERNEEIRDLKGTPLSEGICFGLCVLWADKKARNPSGTAEERIESITGEGTPEFPGEGRTYAKRIQAKYATNITTETEKKLWDEKGFTLGMSGVKDISGLEDYAKDLVDDGNVGTFTALGWHRENGYGGHQLVSYLDKTILYLYDPNGGEFQIPRKKVHEFLKKLWVEMRANLKPMPLAKIGNLQWAKLQYGKGSKIDLKIKK